MILNALAGPWPWYVTGPMLGGVALALLLLGNRMLGVSGTFRVACAATLPRDIAFFRFDWRRTGTWNLAFAAGVVGGGFMAAHLFGADASITLSVEATRSLDQAGITDFTGLVPADLFSWGALTRWGGLTALVGGGFLVGFGAAWGGGCTSGHGILGLADFQLPSALAVLGFFLGGFLGVHLLLPLLV